MIEDFAGKAIGIVDCHENISSYIPKCSHCSVRDGPVFTLLESHSKYAIAVLKDRTRQIYEEVVALSNITEPTTYRCNKTNYKVWEHKISGLWDGYGGEVTAIKSEETTTIRRHSREAGSNSKLLVLISSDE